MMSVAEPTWARAEAGYRIRRIRIGKRSFRMTPLTAQGGGPLMDVSFSIVSSFLSDTAIDPTKLLGEVGSDGCGAVTLFLGTVRRSPEDGDVEGIEYSAYPAMAESE